MDLEPDSGYEIRTVIHTAKADHYLTTLQVTCNGVALKSSGVINLDGEFSHSCFVPANLVEQADGRLRLSFSAGDPAMAKRGEPGLALASITAIPRDSQRLAFAVAGRKQGSGVASRIRARLGALAAR